MLHEMMNIPYEPQPEGILKLDGIPGGTWLAEWVNTLTAETLREELVQVGNGTMLLQTPAVRESIAIRLQKYE